MDFEFVEVEPEAQTPSTQTPSTPNDEFTFRLFNEDDRGRSEVQIVSLREPSEERINNERPQSYYYAQYSEVEKNQFTEVAISGTHIINHSREVNPSRGKVIDLDEYNKSVQKKRRSRPGKNKRAYIVDCRNRKVERNKVKKRIERERIFDKPMRYNKGTHRRWS